MKHNTKEPISEIQSHRTTESHIFSSVAERGLTFLLNIGSACPNPWRTTPPKLITNFLSDTINGRPTPPESRLAAATRILLGGEPSDPDCSDPKLLDEDATRVEIRWTDGFQSTQVALSGSVYLSAVDDVICLAKPVEADSVDSDLTSRAERILRAVVDRLKKEFCHLVARRSARFTAKGSRFQDFIQRLALTSLPVVTGSNDGSINHNSNGLNGRYLSCHVPDHLAGLLWIRQSRSMSLSFPCSSATLSFPSSSSSADYYDGGSDERYVINLDEQVAAFLVDHIPNPICLGGMSIIREIAKRMVHSGYQSVLREVFVSLRRDDLANCRADLDLEDISIEEAQRVESTTMDSKVIRWILALKVFVSVILPSERWLCDQVFSSFDELKDECFAEATMVCIMDLLNSINVFSTLQCLPEKISLILSMHDILADVTPFLMSSFFGTSKDFVGREAESVLRNLANAVKSILHDICNMIKADASRKPLPGGDIHRLTRYLLNYIKFLVHYRTSLDLLLHDCYPDHADSKTAPFARQILALISHLEAMLHEKSRLYNEEALQFVFLMNNTNYIVQKIENTELEAILGDEWLQSRREKIKHCVRSYITVSCTPLLMYLKDGGLKGVGRFRIVNKVLKNRFMSFNSDFERLCDAQATWKVPDPQLRQNLRLAVSEKILPAYTLFHEKFAGYLNGKGDVKYLLFTADDLEGTLLDLFEG